MVNIRQNNTLSLFGIVRSRTTLSVGLLFLVPIHVFLADSATLAAESVPVQAADQNNWVAPKVQVFQREGKWIIEGQRNRIELNPSDLQMTVYTQRQTWSMIPSFRGDLIVENSGARLSLRLADAEKKEISPYQTGFKTGIIIALEDFARKDIKVDVQISLFICLEGEQEELVCELKARPLIATEKTATVMECFWPQAVSNNCFDYTVVPFMQGMLLGKDWPKKVRLYNTVCYGRGLYMPWWGHQKGESAMLVLLETPEDAGCRFEHPAGGPTKIELRSVSHPAGIQLLSQR